jgi:hypothetical protein
VLFDVRRSRSTPWDPDDDEPLTLAHVNRRLHQEGLRLIRVEPVSSPEDKRQAYFLVRLDGREINPARIYGKLRYVALDFFHTPRSAVD